jgi:Cu(I)/Ag(I) efflux system membrane fusion protein
MSAGKLALLALASLTVGECKQAVDHAGHATPPPASSVIAIDPNKLGPLGLTTAKIAEQHFHKELRTTGIVSLDETKTAHVHTKVKGFVEALPASFVGMKIRAGQTLCAIYSQAVYAAQLEHVSLLRARIVEDPVLADAELKVVEASRKRLMLWDVPRAQIDRLEKTLEPQRAFPIAAPRGGVLVAKQAVLGTYVEPGSELFTISDLTKLWVLADVYEGDLPHMKLGQEATLTIEGLPSPRAAKVTFLAPMIDEATRTLKVRLELDNVDGALRPGAFATVQLGLMLGHGLAVPESAVVHTGTRRVVFIVHHGGAHIEPRDITIGEHVGGYYRVTSGLVSGDEVATGAQFLLDSESRLRATTGGGAPGGHGGH